METIESRTSFRVPENNLEELKARVEKLGRRAAKLGLAPPTLEVADFDDEPVSQRETDGTTTISGYRRYYFVELRGEAPTLPGWDLIAVIEHTNDSEIGNVIRTVPGAACPVQYRKANAHCDHCRTTRQRLETFVIRNDSGECRQIGRNCLSDFCRSPEAAESMCAAAEILASAQGLCEGSEDGDFFGTGGRSVQRADVESVLSLTARIIRNQGWISRKAAEITCCQSTSDIVSEVLFSRSFWEKRASDSDELIALRAIVRDIEERDKELAGKALEWIRGQRPTIDTRDDYIYNLLVIASEETVKPKHLGLLCSLVATYSREVEKVEMAKRLAADSRHFGTPGKRETWEATVVSVRPFESNFGTKYLVKLDVGGSLAIWWSSTGAASDLTPGEAVKVKGTVKGHELYNGVKQTELSRCKIESQAVLA